eukprot:gene9105-12279_t
MEFNPPESPLDSQNLTPRSTSTMEVLDATNFNNFFSQKEGLFESELSMVDSHTYDGKELNDAKEVIRQLKSRLVRRSNIIDELRKCYLKDVVTLKHVIKEVLVESERESVFSQFDTSIPSLNFKPLMMLHAPTKTELQIKLCEECGGHLELVHKDSDEIEALKKMISDIRQREDRFRVKLATLDAQLENMVRDKAESTKSHIEEKRVLYGEIKKSKEDCEKAHNDGAHVVKINKKIREENEMFRTNNKHLFEAAEKVDKLEKDLENCQFNLTDAQNSIHEFKQTEKQLRKELLDMKSDYFTLKSQNDHISQELQLSKDILHQNDAIINKLQIDLHHYQGLHDVSTNEIKEYKLKVAELNEKMVQDAKKITEDNKAYEDSINLLKNDLKSKEKLLELGKGHNHQMKNELEHALQVIKNVSEIKHAQELELLECINEFELYDEEIQSMEKLIINFFPRTVSSQEEADKIKAMLSSLEAIHAAHLNASKRQQYNNPEDYYKNKKIFEDITVEDRHATAENYSDDDDNDNNDIQYYDQGQEKSKQNKSKIKKESNKKNRRKSPGKNKNNKTQINTTDNHQLLEENTNYNLTNDEILEYSMEAKARLAKELQDQLAAAAITAAFTAANSNTHSTMNIPRPRTRPSMENKPIAEQTKNKNKTSSGNSSTNIQNHPISTNKTLEKPNKQRNNKSNPSTAPTSAKRAVMNKPKPAPIESNLSVQNLELGLDNSTVGSRPTTSYSSRPTTSHTVDSNHSNHNDSYDNDDLTDSNDINIHNSLAAQAIHAHKENINNINTKLKPTKAGAALAKLRKERSKTNQTFPVLSRENSSDSTLSHSLTMDSHSILSSQSYLELHDDSISHKKITIKSTMLRTNPLLPAKSFRISEADSSVLPEIKIESALPEGYYVKPKLSRNNSIPKDIKLNLLSDDLNDISLHSKAKIKTKIVKEISQENGDDDKKKRKIVAEKEVISKHRAPQTAKGIKGMVQHLGLQALSAAMKSE